MRDECWIAITDQKNKQILVLDPDTTTGNNCAVKWSWKPCEDTYFNDITAGWRLPSDARLRKHDFGWGSGQWMCVCDGDGFAAVIPFPVVYPGKRWAVNAGTEPNLHAIELLPDGNVALAASRGGWVRIYTASQGFTDTNFTQYDIPGAHGVLWDPLNDLLWTVGDSYITGLRITGTEAEPVITEDFSLRKNLPTLYGHDLQPVYGNTDRLWVTTNAGVYQYIKSSKSWDTGYPGAESINRSFVKGIGNQPSGRPVVWARQKGVFHSWCTDTIDILILDEEPFCGKHVLRESAFYKVRVWNPDYQ